MRVPRMRAWLPIAVPALLLGLLLLLAGCASGGGDIRITPVASSAATVSATPTLAPTTMPTVASVATPGAQQGAAEFCAHPASVSAQLPVSVPAYPGADLRIGQSSGGFGIYGLCTRADVATVATYYAGHLPAKGWQQIQTTSIATVRQVTATQGSAQLTVTIQPDAQLATTTDIIVQTAGF